MDAIDLFRAKMSGTAPQEAPLVPTPTAPPVPVSPPMDPIARFQAAQTDVGGLPEFIESAPRVGRLTEPGLSPMSAIQATLRSFITDDPERLAKSLEGIEGITVGRGKDKKPFVEVKGKKYQLNREGLSTQDLANFTTSLVSQIGLGRAARLIPGLRATKSIPGTIAPKTKFTEGLPAEVLAGGVGSGAKEFGEQAAAGEEVDPFRAGIETSLGIGGALVSTLLGNSFGRLFKSGARLLEKGTMTLTRTGREALRAAKVDPDSLDAATLRSADALLRQQAGGRPTAEEVVEGIARTDETTTGIPLTAAQRTGRFGEKADEVKLAEGARGERAQEVMSNFQEQQDEAVSNVVEGVARRESGVNIPRVNEAEAGGRIRQDLISRQTAMEADVDQAYGAATQAAQASGIKVPSDPSSIRPYLDPRKAGIPGINDKIAPRSYAIAQDIEDIFEAASERARDAARASGVKDPKALAQIVGELDPVELEGARKILGKAIRGTKDGEDRAVLIGMRSKFDDYVDDVVGTQDPNLKPLYETARNANAELKKAFSPTDEYDVGGKLIKKTVAGGNVDQSVVDSILGSGNKINPDGVRAFQRVSRVIGPGSTGMAELRQSMTRRLILGTEDAQAAQTLTPERVIANIDRALEGRGSTYVSQVLSPTTLRDMQVIRRQMQRLVRPAGLKNAPRSGYISEAAMRAIARNSLGTILGGVIGSGGGAFGSGMVGSIAGGVGGIAVGKGIDKIANAAANNAGRKAAEKAIRQTTNINGPIQRLVAKTRPVTGPVGRAAEGLLPPVGAPAANSLFDLYGPEL